ncbi:hypothetical protein BN126350086 [Stenotrophomonas maltophilia]|nr:hypothetical protein BN126350086 [Stenotrophomonas maltophilia]
MTGRPSPPVSSTCRRMREAGMGAPVEGEDFSLWAGPYRDRDGIAGRHDIPCTGDAAGAGPSMRAFTPWEGRFVGRRLQRPKRHASLREPSLETRHAAAHPAPAGRRPRRRTRALR